jgi:endogenous inhibitor of DNA gyrase (YacG/DUF329 family)
MMMKTVVCPKCNQVHAVPEGKDFAFCCDEVIYVPNEIHDRETSIET